MLKALVISLIIWVVVTFFVRVYGKSMNAAERIEYELFQKTPKKRGALAAQGLRIFC